jgi:hypothetical protein
VKNNREVLGRLINVTCFLAKQELAFTGHDESSISLNKGNYIELIHLLARYDERLANHLSAATAFKGTSNRTEHYLFNSVADVMFEDIKSQIASAPFVSILIDEFTDTENGSQLSTMVRYVTKNSML